MIHIRAIDPIKTMRRVVVVLLCLMLLAAVTNCTTDQLNIYRALTGMELLDDPPPPAAAPGEPELEVDPLIDPVDPVDPGGTTQTVAETISRFVPEPYRTVLVGGLGLLVAARNKRNGRIIAEAIEGAKSNGVVDFNNENITRYLNTQMSRGAKRMVDEAQGKTKVKRPI